jgi:glycerophosphoryl diester phosphodiesterase
MKPKIIAHRGHIKDNPENTLSAFQAALTTGADAIELDVHMTRDGELIVHHDYYLGNPDSGEGKIHEKDFAYLQTLTINNNEHIPTLEEVFQLIGTQLQYEIELKGFGKAFLEKMIALVVKHSVVAHVEFTSPHAYTLTHIKEQNPKVRTGRFIAPLPSWMDKKLGQTLAINDALLGRINVLHCPIDIIDKQFVQNAHSKGLFVHAADCDTDNALRAAFHLNVDQLSTNELERAIKLATSYSFRS